MSKKKRTYENIPDDILEEYKETFDTYDVNGDGVIDKKELKVILKNLGEPTDEKTIKQIFDDLGKSRQEKINFEEFIEFIQQYHLDTNTNSTEEILKAFQVFDRNHNGVLSLSEFKHILTDLGQKFSEEEVKELFEETDLNKDGSISYEEFVKFWQEQ